MSWLEHPERPLTDLSEEAQEAIAEERRHGRERAAGDDRQADVEADRYERWLDSWP